MEIWDNTFVPQQLVDMEIALISSGIQREVKTLLGHSYFFAAERGSQHQEIAGTIESIRTSDEGVLVLGVTSPTSTFWGEKLFGLAFVNGTWCAYIDVKGVNERFIAGQLMLL